MENARSGTVVFITRFQGSHVGAGEGDPWLLRKASDMYGTGVVGFTANATRMRLALTFFAER